MYYSSFREVYDMSYTFETSTELLEYVKSKRWYFDRLKPKAKQNIRDLYRRMREDEEWRLK